MCRRTVAAIMTIPLLVTAACERQPDTTPAFQHEIRDSAGIRIIQNPRPDPDSRLGWQVGTEPVFTIGSVEAEEAFQLHRVDDALKLRDGRIVVANGGSHQLLVFDDSGNYLAAWGQKGEGPGDFGGGYGSDGLGPPGLFWMEPWPGDSLAVCHGTHTGGNHILSIWDTQGHHGRTLNLANLAPGEDVPFCRDVLPDGAILASLAPFLPSSPTGPEKGFRRSEVDFFLVDADGSRRHSIAKHPGATMFWHWEDDPNDSFLIMDPPFQPTVLWAAWGELIIVSPTDHFELRAYRPDGSLTRIVRRDNDVRNPTQADLDSYRAERRSPDPSRSSARNRNAALDALPAPPESFPAFSAIEVDLLGNLWVREYNLPGQEDRALWTVFDPEGLVQGFVETPQRLQIYEIGGDYILGKVLDELRVEYVQLWPLDRGG